VGLLLIAIALLLPLVAGALSWPWRTVVVSVLLIFIGFFSANYRRMKILDDSGGVPRVIARLRLPSTPSCAAYGSRWAIS
jgi:hypothetical protein